MRSAVAILVISFVACHAGAGETEPQYVGVDACKTCHKKELIGDQHGVWLEGPHAKAYETLLSDDAKEIAREKGVAKPPHEAPECLSCHSTAHGLTPAQIKAKPLGLKDGVQCESCHGPGSFFKSKKTMSDHEKAVSKGLWDPGNDATICTSCHNAKSPTFEGFDHAERLKEIDHPIPKDVKGRYLEAVKERKARGD